MRALLRRLEDERGATLVEVQMVMVIMGILATSAGPSVLGAVDQAKKIAAASNVSSAVPLVEAYYLDNGSYLGMDVASGGLLGGGLQAYDPSPGVRVDPAQSGWSSYCVYSTVGSFTFYKAGPLGEIVEDTTPTESPCAA